MVIKRGFLEILQLAQCGRPKSFNDFTRIHIGNSTLSSATVSKRLDRLISVNAMEEVVTKSKTGRRIIVYKVTEKGKKMIELSSELEELVGVPTPKPAC
jgi:DNA-binding HxlR family transcriptional regulator